MAELAERTAGALVTELPRQPGARENRWMPLLSGTPVIDEERLSHKAVSAKDSTEALDEIAALKANVVNLEIELSELRKIVGKVCAELGISLESGINNYGS